MQNVPKDNIVEILDADVLFRRVVSYWVNGAGNISSAVFYSRSGPLSIYIAKLTTPKKILDKFSEYKLSSVVTKFVRSLELDAVHDPLDDDYAHGLIVGKINKSKAKKLAKSARLVSE